MVKDFGFAEISFIIISKDSSFVKPNLCFFERKFGNTGFEVISLRFARKAALFTLGGGAYVGLELLYRGRSHVSMFAAGGLCLLLVGPLGQTKLPLPARLLLGMGIITTVELAIGLTVNRDYAVWDYRDLPGNFLGQICPQFCLLWLPLSAAAMGVYGKMMKWIN